MNMKKLVIVTALLLITFTACKKEENVDSYPSPSYPVADFQIHSIEENGYGRWFVSVVNQSINYEISMWEWGDGSHDTRTSSDVSPYHYYNEEGTYTITLTVQDSEGYTDSKSKTITL